ncbi:uncharacterized protein LOC120197568 [Hibiscus syriacus]|uniref:uncharacterized protein LOC120197568 n=1 Tax=Hibiscus syriacus TaxID=106335 RepID=UPI001924974E|nr:uncharacterized protein LOC120197568 [Hibiscus syriacus]
MKKIFRRLQPKDIVNSMVRRFSSLSSSVQTCLIYALSIARQWEQPTTSGPPWNQTEPSKASTAFQPSTIESLTLISRLMPLFLFPSWSLASSRCVRICFRNGRIITSPASPSKLYQAASRIFS